ncbi:ribonuclease H-like domain-containing protein [Halanaerobiaceae bacterium Z-7014]|uniref:Ribonuclease H-like domain-containing protein n=1 Tax=Halonatronomonas betaini TaxID=2778430 RepID=A0A931F800_9FIRM|nr:ribonuclease H-like domain-containing protein [Halonatronomonas betaini]MBF8437216.1 ribonuclease H-like domain-containing protein [Halonatronomonas betaini]
MNLREKLKKMPGQKREQTDSPEKPATVYLEENRYPLSYCHGRYSLEDFSEYPFQNAGAIFDLPEELSRDELLFLDTETTGLAGGAGTVAFMIGLAYFAGDEVVLEQYIMRDYDEEPDQLEAVKERIEERSNLVTFNGKCYDFPLLKDRFIMNRLEPPVLDNHIDLLHPARSLWRHLPSCSLKALEWQVIDFRRGEDIDGSQVPEQYFQYLKEKDFELLRPIIEHNRDDIISMISLARHLGEIVSLSDSIDWDGNKAYNLGYLFEKDGQLEKSIRLYERARDLQDSARLLTRIDKKLTWQYKRADCYDQAIKIWQEMIREKRGGLFPWVELAKYYEHQAKDYDSALKLVEAANKFLLSRRYYISDWKDRKDALDHRLDRLERKLARRE